MMEASAPPRYSQHPFPPYRFLPFRNDPTRPHPRNDPAGHSFHTQEEFLPSFDPDDWRNCEPYLYGIDLFNHGYFWEAHEAWEAVWLAAGQQATLPGRIVQGLIQLAAAQLKRVIDNPRGARRLTDAGCAKLSEVDGVYFGIHLPRFVRDARRCLEEERGEFPQIELRF